MVIIKGIITEVKLVPKAQPRDTKVKVKVFRQSDSVRGRPAQMWPIASNISKKK